MLQKKKSTKIEEKTILFTNLISAELKYHDKYRKDLARDDGSTSTVRRPADDFKGFFQMISFFLRMRRFQCDKLCW